MAADNEAKIIITADPAQFQKFLVDTVRGLREVEKEGKKSVKELDSAFATFQKNSAEAAKAILREVTGPVTDPLKQAYNQALGNAREWRRESTRIMGETGSDWKVIGGEIDSVSLRTRRMPEDTARYLDTVRQLTGSWKVAKDSAEDYSDLARVLGKQTLSEMAPLAGTMQNVFRVENVKGFFEQAIAGAKALGQSGEMTARQWERVAPMMTGMVPKAQGPAFAKSAAAMLPAMQKLGLSPEESEMAMQQIIGNYSGDNLINLERQMKGAGVLAKGEHLKDKYGRLTRSIPELMQLESRLIKQHAKGLGGGAAREEKIAKQSVAPLMAGLLLYNDQFQKYISEAAEAQPAGEIEARKRALEQTPEMQRQLNDRIAAIRSRKDIGDKQLLAQDLGAALAAGGPEPKPGEEDWRQSLFSTGKRYSAYASMIPGAGKLGAAATFGFATAEASLQATKDAATRGQSVFGVGKGLSADAIGGATQTHGMTLSELFGKLFSKDAQRDQAAATADALGQKVLKVQLVAPASPVSMSGGGEQG